MIVAPRTGFDTHPHQDMEIVTWVLSGELEHKHTLGNKGLIYSGLAQRMSASRGIWHSEKNNTLLTLLRKPARLDAAPQRRTRTAHRDAGCSASKKLRRG